MTSCLIFNHPLSSIVLLFDVSSGQVSSGDDVRRGGPSVSDIREVVSGCITGGYICLIAMIARYYIHRHHDGTFSVQGLVKRTTLLRRLR